MTCIDASRVSQYSKHAAADFKDKPHKPDLGGTDPVKHGKC